MKLGGGIIGIRRSQQLSLAVMRRLRSLAVVFVAAIGGCSNSSMSDLESYVADVLGRKGWPIEPLPTVVIPPSHVYQSSDRRDPFQPDIAVVDEGKQPEMTASNGGVRPPEQRNREELEGFPLDALRMAGTLEQGIEMWALILGPEGTVYRVQKGNYVGRNYGKIHSIVEDRIELTEIIPDGQGGWQEREAALALAEK